MQKLTNILLRDAYKHKTNEITKLIDEDVEIAFVGFASASIVNSTNKFSNATIYCFGYDAKLNCKETKGTEYPQIKILILRTKIILTTADLTLKSYDEISLVFNRTACLLDFCLKHIQSYKQFEPLQVLL